MSLDPSVPTAMAVIDPARAWILGILPGGRRRWAAHIVNRSTGGALEATAASVEIRDDCACPDSCARDHDNE
jgi:hypothetical protein